MSAKVITTAHVSVTASLAPIVQALNFPTPVTRVSVVQAPVVQNSVAQASVVQDSVVKAVVTTSLLPTLQVPLLPDGHVDIYHECLVSLGTNIEPDVNFNQALHIIGHECDLLAHSNAIRTAPVGFQQQPDFLNAALLVRTPMEREVFRRYLKGVEDRLGRVRGAIKSGPRTMDLDMVAWDGELIDESYYQYDYVRTPIDEVLANSGRYLKLQKYS